MAKGRRWRTLNNRKMRKQGQVRRPNTKGVDQMVRRFIRHVGEIREVGTNRTLNDVVGDMLQLPVAYGMHTVGDRFLHPSHPTRRVMDGVGRLVIIDEAEPMPCDFWERKDYDWCLNSLPTFGGMPLMQVDGMPYPLIGVDVSNSLHGSRTLLSFSDGSSIELDEQQSPQTLNIIGSSQVELAHRVRELTEHLGVELSPETVRIIDGIIERDCDSADADDAAAHVESIVGNMDIIANRGDQN